jgi:putative ATP-grasp target RiPP
MTISDLTGAATQFPLGEQYGPAGEEPEGVTPFGLRYATPPGPGAVTDVDWSAIGYDPARQIATVTEDGEQVPAMKHTSGQTSTSTATQDRSGGDKDTDTTQD